MIIVSIAIVILTNLGIIFQRIEYALLDFRITKAKGIVNQQILDNILLNDNIEERDIDKLALSLKRLSNKHGRYNQVVIDEIIFYHQNFSDSTGELLYRLYYRLDLIKDSLHKLTKSAWNVQAKGLREIQQMPPSEEHLAFVYPLLNSKNNDLRIEAQAAFLRLSKDNPFKFLDLAKEELLEWHQIILFEIIGNTEDLEVPDFKNYFKSPNLSVITFCIKLVVHFQQLNSIPELIELIDHPADTIKKTAISALGLFSAEQSEQRMVEAYPKHVLSVKLKIISALGLIASGNSIDFLKKVFFSSEEFSLIKTAACALLSHSDLEINLVFRDVDNLSSDRKAIISHCTNALIRN